MISKIVNPIVGIIIGLAVVIASQSVFTVNETQQVIVLQFGNPVHVYQEPGLKFKIPFVQNLKYIDSRILEVDPEPEELLLADQKRLVVDTFLRYKISDPLLYYKTLNSENAAKRRLQEQVNSSLRSNLGKVNLPDVLSSVRTSIMAQIQEEVNADVERLGLTVADVRIVRADLPTETSQAIYARMVSEREREASEARAQGQEMAQQIRSKAERERTVLIAEAEKKAQITRGVGDEEAIKIYADAFQQDEEFYGFYRSLEAYRKSMNKDNTTLVLSPESEFFRFLKDKRLGQ
ncbi:MAG: HflC protein [Rickettsiales bacterium]|nr:HflC protein [Rickettsiales bacterium]